jgi:protein-arginine kinase activator protein McsA
MHENECLLSASLMIQEPLPKGKLFEYVCIVCKDVETEDLEPGAEPSDQFRSHTANRCPMSQQERVWRDMAYDYEIRFCGHCNTTTDIKEANFFGR